MSKERLCALSDYMRYLHEKFNLPLAKLQTVKRDDEAVARATIYSKTITFSEDVLAKYSLAELKAILIHELVHIHLSDTHSVNFVTKCLELARQLEVDDEATADALKSWTLALLMP